MSSVGSATERRASAGASTGRGTDAPSQASLGCLYITPRANYHTVIQHARRDGSGDLNMQIGALLLSKLDGMCATLQAQTNAMTAMVESNQRFQ